MLDYKRLEDSDMVRPNTTVHLQTCCPLDGSPTIGDRLITKDLYERGYACTLGVLVHSDENLNSYMIQDVHLSLSQLKSLRDRIDNYIATL